jgi:hypothetical protein
MSQTILFENSNGIELELEKKNSHWTQVKFRTENELNLMNQIIREL